MQYNGRGLVHQLPWPPLNPVRPPYIATHTTPITSITLPTTNDPADTPPSASLYTSSSGSTVSVSVARRNIDTKKLQAPLLPTPPRYISIQSLIELFNIQYTVHKHTPSGAINTTTTTTTTNNNNTPYSNTTDNVDLTLESSCKIPRLSSNIHTSNLLPPPLHVTYNNIHIILTHNITHISYSSDYRRLFLGQHCEIDYSTYESMVYSYGNSMGIGFALVYMALYSIIQYILSSESGQVEDRVENGVYSKLIGDEPHVSYEEYTRIYDELACLVPISCHMIASGVSVTDHSNAEYSNNGGEHNVQHKGQNYDRSYSILQAVSEHPIVMTIIQYIHQHLIPLPPTTTPTSYSNHISTTATTTHYTNSIHPSTTPPPLLLLSGVWQSQVQGPAVLYALNRMPGIRFNYMPLAAAAAAAI